MHSDTGVTGYGFNRETDLWISLCQIASNGLHEYYILKKTTGIECYSCNLNTTQKIIYKETSWAKAKARNYSLMWPGGGQQNNCILCTDKRTRLNLSCSQIIKNSSLSGNFSLNQSFCIFDYVNFQIKDNLSKHDKGDYKCKQIRSKKSLLFCIFRCMIIKSKSKNFCRTNRKNYFSLQCASDWRSNRILLLQSFDRSLAISAWNLHSISNNVNRLNIEIQFSFQDTIVILT